MLRGSTCNIVVLQVDGSAVLASPHSSTPGIWQVLAMRWHRAESQLKAGLIQKSIKSAASPMTRIAAARDIHQMKS
jgi:hypothetical protein